MFGFNIFDPRLLRFCTKHKKAFFKKSVENYGGHQREQILKPINRNLCVWKFTLFWDCQICKYAFLNKNIGNFLERMPLTR